MNDTVTEEELIEARAQLVLINGAITATLTGNIQSYRRDSGQGATSVVHLNLSELRNMKNSLMNQCAVLETRLNGTGSLNVRPGW